MTEPTVDEYMSKVPEPHRSTLAQLRALLHELLPDAEESLSYGVPALKLKGKPVAGYAAFENHCSYFPHSGSILENIADELSGYEWSKGTLKFPPDQPLSDGLVRRLVWLRLDQIET